jgi:hypothetical protein
LANGAISSAIGGAVGTFFGEWLHLFRYSCMLVTPLKCVPGDTVTPGRLDGLLYTGSIYKASGTWDWKFLTRCYVNTAVKLSFHMSTKMPRVVERFLSRTRNVYLYTRPLWHHATMLTPWSRVLEKLVVTQLVKNLPPFMEPDGSLPCSQKPATGPYHEPDKPSPHLPTPLPYDLF